MHLFRLILPVLAGLFLTTSLSAQTVSGVVNDENGQPLPGATVLANGGARGASTDMDGRYILSLGAGTHSINYSFVGYLKANRSVTLAAGETKVVNVQLETDAVVMDDVVVVGYGVQRKKEVTGSIAQIDSKQITAVRTPSSTPGSCAIASASCPRRRRCCPERCARTSSSVDRATRTGSPRCWRPSG